MRILWLADELRGAGLTVVEHAGWQTRGWEPWQPRWGIVHATAAPRSQLDSIQVDVVKNGRVGLAGPIANCCVDRDGRWHVLASGQCNTALVGWGGPAAGFGNRYLLGVEACNDNGRDLPAVPAERWPDVQYEAYVRGWAVICRRMGWPAWRCIGHREHQPRDKTDPTFAMDAFRARVARLIEEDDMLTADEVADKVLERIVAHRWPRVDGHGNAGLEKSVEWARQHGGDVKGDVRKKVLPKLDALLAANQGLDTEAILARIDQRAAEDAARDAALFGLLEQHAAGSLDAEAVVQRIGELLTAASAAEG